jgi:hypothetical protein
VTAEEPVTTSAFSPIDRTKDTGNISKLVVPGGGSSVMRQRSDRGTEYLKESSYLIA